MTLEWFEHKEWSEASVPVQDPRGTGTWHLYICRRPPYCDRGGVFVQIMEVGPVLLDHQEGFPRYYSTKEVAKSEMEWWVNRRTEIHAALRG